MRPMLLPGVGAPRRHDRVDSSVLDYLCRVVAATSRGTLTPEPLAAAVDWIEDVGAVWDERLGALKRLLENGPNPGPAA